jgi:hypothetical protein
MRTLPDFFGHNDYKLLLREVVRTRPRRGYGQLNQLAAHLKVHSSLVSQILNGPKDFTLEQALGVARFFRFDGRETEYFLLLVQAAKAGTEELRSFHRGQARRFQREALEVSSRISGDTELAEADKALYYSDWSYMAVWLATMVARLRTPEAIASALGLEPAEATRILAFLERAGLCEPSSEGYAARVCKTHVPASSPLARRHHVNWRLQAIERAARLGDGDLMFTAPMTLAAVDKAWLKRRLLDLIQEASELVKASPCEQLACLNIDLFDIASVTS